MILAHRIHPEAVVPLRPLTPVVDPRDTTLAELEAEIRELREANAGLAEALAAAGPKGRAKSAG